MGRVIGMIHNLSTARVLHDDFPDGSVRIRKKKELGLRSTGEATYNNRYQNNTQPPFHRE
jgi:hypothetical protein